MKIKLNNIPLWLVCGILYLPPWLFSGHITYIQPIDIVLCVLTISAIVSNHRYQDGIMDIKEMQLSFLFFILLGFIIIFSQIFNSINYGSDFQYKDLHYTITIIKYVLFFFIAASFSARIKIQNIYYFIPFLIVIQILIMFFQYYDVANINDKFSLLYQQSTLFEDVMYRPEGRRVTGTFGNPNHSSYILTFGMAWLCSIFFYSKRILIKTICVIVGALSILAISFLTGSRSNGFIVLSLIPVTAILYFLKSKKIIFIPVLIFGIIVIIVALSFSVEFIKSIGVQDRVVNVISDSSSTLNSLSNRLLVGERNFKNVTLFQFFIGVGAKTKFNQICDNGFIQMFLYGGLPALLIYLFFLGGILKYFLKKYFAEDDNAEDDNDNRFISLVGVLTVISWIVYEWVADAFWNFQTCQLFIVTVAICFGYLNGFYRKQNLLIQENTQ